MKREFIYKILEKQVKNKYATESQNVERVREEVKTSIRSSTLNKIPEYDSHQTIIAKVSKMNVSRSIQQRSKANLYRIRKKAYLGQLQTELCRILSRDQVKKDD